MRRLSIRTASRNVGVEPCSSRVILDGPSGISDSLSTTEFPRQPKDAPMPSEFALKTMNRVHRTMMAMSCGKLGWTAGKMPVLELTTIGRKSGQPRSTMLTAPWQDGDRMAIIASAGGNDKHPAWFLNLRDDSSVTVRTSDDTKKMTARITSGDERADIWSAVTSKYKNYADYQSKTEREIPVVLLEPAG